MKVFTTSLLVLGLLAPIGAAFGQIAGGNQNFTDVQVFNSPGTVTWLVPNHKVTWVRVKICGGGGGGGGGPQYAAAADKSAFGGGGGGGAACLEDLFRAADLVPSQAITIGAGGTGGAGALTTNTDGSDGSTGGDSSFGSIMTAYGGGGGVGGVAALVAPANGGGGGSGFGAGSISVGVPVAGHHGGVVQQGTITIGDNFGVSGGAGGGQLGSPGSTGIGGYTWTYGGPGGGAGGVIDANTIVPHDAYAGGGSVGCKSPPAGGTVVSPNGNSYLPDVVYHVGCGGSGGAAALGQTRAPGDGGHGTMGGGGGGGGPVCSSDGAVAAGCTAQNGGSGGSGGAGYAVITAW